MFSLRDTGLSGKRVNNILTVLRVMLKEAVRLNLLQKNPFEVVRPLAVQNRERGVLVIDEVKKLFDPSNILPIWNGYLLHRSINMLAASTGMRRGEVLALRDEDIKGGYIHVSHGYGPYGIGPTKTRQERDVPVPARVMESIGPFVGSGGFVFSFNLKSRRFIAR